MNEVALTKAGMEIGCALNVDGTLAMKVFANIETFTKNMHRDTLNKHMLNPANMALIQTGAYIALCKNRLCTSILQP